MDKVIKKVTTIEGLFNRQSIDLYYEDDLLRQGEQEMTRFGLYDNFFWEEYEVRQIIPHKIEIGMCINSIPFFCRYEEYEEEYGTCVSAYHISLQKKGEDYNRICPKCGWGLSAYLAIRCKADARFGIRYYDERGNETNQRTTFEAYLNICRTIYKAIHQDDYTHYKAIGDVEALNRLEVDFISQHRKAEEQYRNISGEVDRLFFGGQLGKVVGEYLNYVSGFEAGGYQKGQQSDRWVITPECLIVFGDSESATVFLDSVIGKHYNITMYGKSMKAYAKQHGITKQYGFGKKVWLLICANDKSMNPESDDTFTSAW